MAYDYKLYDASFRGVSFYVTDADTTFGRRTVLHEYPQRDTPFVEDMGKKARTFTVQAFVVGNDFQSKRDKLLDALETEGSGVLVHPWFGTLTVQVMDDCSVHDSWENGGKSEITIKFCETQDTVYPTSTENSVSQMEDTCDDFETVCSDAFDGTVTIDNSTEATFGEDVLTAINDLVNDGLLGEISKNTKKLAAFTKKIEAFTSAVSTLIRSPLKLISQFQSIIGTLAGATADAVAAVTAYVKLYDTISSYFATSDATISSETSLGTVELANNTAIKKMMLAAVVESAALSVSAIQYGQQVRAVVSSSDDDIISALDIAEGTAVADDQEVISPGSIYVTADDIKSSKEDVLDIIDDVSAIVDDTVFLKLAEIREIINNMDVSDMADVKYLQKKQINSTIPALVFTYNLYGSLDNLEDVIARNSIEHPGTVPSGVELEVVIS